jgi:sulfoxide reductase catalytic subunit YedY
MTWIRTERSWQLGESDVTPERIVQARREFLKTLGAVGAGALLGTPGCLDSVGAQSFDPAVRATLPGPRSPYPVARSTRYTVTERELTPEEIAASHNNYYEFTTDKKAVWRLARKLETSPWQVEVTGLVKKPTTFDIEDLVSKMPLEERIYRMRCVEAWSMVVPWVGFPMNKLLERVEPTSEARYVRFASFNRPEEAIGQKTQPWYKWPYYEGLRLDEAMHDLTLLATGSYGHALPAQHGAPLRLVVPWKYGFKGIKGIVKIELVKEKPATFWNDLAPDEYDFLATVDPGVPHPRWSQARETDIGTSKVHPTLKYNGYGDEVASLYRK